MEEFNILTESIVFILWLLGQEIADGDAVQIDTPYAMGAKPF